MSYYNAQDAITKYYGISPLDTQQLPYFRFQIMLSNIQKMIKEEEAKRKKAEEEAKRKNKNKKNKKKIK